MCVVLLCVLCVRVCVHARAEANVRTPSLIVLLLCQ